MRLDIEELRKLKALREELGEWPVMGYYSYDYVDATDAELRSLGFIPAFLQERTVKEILAFMFIEGVQLD